MTIVLSTPPYQQFYDLNGDPLSGGKVYTYIAGTTTPTATYTDQTGVTPSANPIILDSAGRAVWWLDSGISYKYIVKDSLDNTIKTVDTVIPFTVASSSIATIAANTIVGNNTGAIASPLALTTDQVKTMLSPSQIQPISASVAANALTISASALFLDFRSSTLGSGAISSVSGTPSNLVVPTSATLGTTNGVASRLIVLAINSSGTIELAVVNASGATSLSETGVINTIAISASSTSSSVIYSTTARTGVPYRVIGYIDSTQATAGTWATAPSTIQGFGGNSTWANIPFVSADQTITSGGALTLAHSLGIAPKFVSFELICQTGEAGYTAGDVVQIPPTGFNTGGSGNACVANATNVLVRFGNSASAYNIPNFSTGASANLTNANWKLRVKAWA